MLKTLDSGAMIDISIASFAEGTKLMKAVAKELKNTQINVGAKGKTTDFLSLELGDDALNTIKNIVSGLIASEDVEAALWPCMERGTYKVGDLLRKINRDLFEDEKIRADYLPVLKEVLVYNLAPFFGSLKSLVKGLPGGNTVIQKL